MIAFDEDYSSTRLATQGVTAAWRQPSQCPASDCSVPSELAAHVRATYMNRAGQIIVRPPPLPATTMSESSTSDNVEIIAQYESL